MKKNKFLAFGLSLFGLIVFSGCSLSLPENDSAKNIPEKIAENTGNLAKDVVSAVQEISEKSEKKDSSLKKLVQKEQEISEKKGVELVLVSHVREDESILVQVVLKNPQQEELQSVQAWFLYPTSILKGEDIALFGKNKFPLQAPNENGFDAKNGIVKIGLSASGKPAKTPENLVVAEVIFQKISDSPFQLEFFADHKKVMMLTENGLRNVVKEEK